MSISARFSCITAFALCLGTAWTARIKQSNFVDTDQDWAKGLYGSLLCDDDERREFEEIFGVLPSKDGQMDVWSKPVGDASGKPKALILYPDADHNGAFAINDHMCYRLLSLARIYPDTKLVHVSTVDEAYAILEGTPDGSVEHLVVGGHGLPTSLSLGLCHSTVCSLKIYTPSAKRFWELANRKLLPGDGRIFLDSCLNGQEDEKTEHNNAKYVASLIPGHKIYSSKICFSPSNLVVSDFKEFDLLIRGPTDSDGNKLANVQNHVNVKNCETSPKHWEDEDGRSCEEYAKGGLCHLNGNIPGTAGYTSREACCQCGGGKISNQEKVCPPSSDPTPDGFCVCSSRTAQLHKNRQPSKALKFRPAEASEVQCLEANECPVQGHAGYFSSYSNLCSCSKGSLCFKGDSKEPGCPGAKAGETKTNGFAPSCSDCACKKSAPPQVTCDGGICTCPAQMTCFKGDRKGLCPVDPDYSSKQAIGPVEVSANSFAETCLLCSCRMECLGAAKGQAKDGAMSASDDGTCTCGSNAACHHGKAKSKAVVESWGSTWKAKAVSVGEMGTCPWPGSTLLGDTYIDMFKCPDCYCAYSGKSRGAPTEKGSTCQIGWELNGKKCDRPDGCCNINDDKKGPWCPTTDPKIGIGPFGDAAFKYDHCTATFEVDAKWVAAAGSVYCKLKGYSKKKCGSGNRVFSPACKNATTGSELSETKCLQYAAKPEAGIGEECFECDDCSTEGELCESFCKKDSHCEYLSCTGCQVCLDLMEKCNDDVSWVR